MDPSLIPVQGIIQTLSNSVLPTAALVAVTTVNALNPAVIVACGTGVVAVVAVSAIKKGYEYLTRDTAKDYEKDVIVRIWTLKINPRETVKRYKKKLDYLQETIEKQLKKIPPGGGGELTLYTGPRKSKCGGGQADDVISLLKKLLAIVKTFKEVLSEYEKEGNDTVTFLKIYKLTLQFYDLIYSCKCGSFIEDLIKNIDNATTIIGIINDVFEDYNKTGRKGKEPDLLSAILKLYKGGLLQPVDEILKIIQSEKWDSDGILAKCLEFVNNITLEFYGCCAASCVTDIAKTVHEMEIEQKKNSGTVTDDLKHLANTAIVAINFLLLCHLRKP